MTRLLRVAIHEAGHATAAITYGIPIVRATIAADIPHLYRGYYRAPADIALECMTTLCLAGPEAERYFCGAINDAGDEADYQMAREYLAQRRFDVLRIEAEIVRARAAAARLVRDPWAQDRIRLIADALLRHGSLSAADIGGIIPATLT